MLKVYNICNHTSINFNIIILLFNLYFPWCYTNHTIHVINILKIKEFIGQKAE